MVKTGVRGSAFGRVFELDTQQNVPFRLQAALRTNVSLSQNNPNIATFSTQLAFALDRMEYILYFQGEHKEGYFG
jgi:hypothetical protein